VAVKETAHSAPSRSWQLVDVGDLRKRSRQYVSLDLCECTYVVSGQEARPGHRLEARLALDFILVSLMQNRIMPNLAGLGVAIFIGFSSLQALARMTSGALSFSILHKDKLASRRGDRSRRSISARKDRKASQALKLQ